MTKLSPNRVREILAVSLRGDSMLGVDVEREELTALAQEVLDLRTANGLLDSLVCRLEEDNRGACAALDTERREHLATATKALAYAEKTGSAIRELEAMVGRVETAAGLHPWE